MKETKTVVLADNREIVLKDEEEILLYLIADGTTQYIFSVPYPAEGYGGGSLLLSATEQYLLFSYFSGQSEEAFMLFKIDNRHLDLLYESGYSYGEMADYFFSGDEHLLFQAFRTGWWYADMTETDENGNAFYEFGEINILDIREKTLDKHRIRVYPSGDWEEEVTDNGPFQFAEIIDNSILKMAMPWGQEILHCPLEDVIVLRPKRSIRV